MLPIILLAISNVLLLLLLIETVRRGLDCRRWLKAVQGQFDSPIPTVGLDEFHPLFAQSEFGSTLLSEISFIGSCAPSGTTDTETWVLSVLAKGAKCMFEFGTCTGKTAYLWARNSAPDATIFTLTLAPEKHADYAAAAGDEPLARRQALMESAFDTFIYSGTPVEHKITQLFSDSKRFDETPYLRRCDLIFVDGSHAYSYIKSDTEKALRMIKPGGIILWHDYRYRLPETADVKRYLDGLSGGMPLVRLEGTVLVACCIDEPYLSSFGRKNEQGLDSLMRP